MNKHLRSSFACVTAIAFCSACAVVEQYVMKSPEGNTIITASRECASDGNYSCDELVITGDLGGKLKASGDVPTRIEMEVDVSGRKKRISVGTDGQFEVPISRVTLDIKGQGSKSVRILLKFLWEDDLKSNGEASRPNPESAYYELCFVDDRLELRNSLGAPVQNLDIAVSFRQVKDQKRLEELAKEVAETRERMRRIKAKVAMLRKEASKPTIWPDARIHRRVSGGPEKLGLKKIASQIRRNSFFPKIGLPWLYENVSGENGPSYDKEDYLNFCSVVLEITAGLVASVDRDTSRVNAERYDALPADAKAMVLRFHEYISMAVNFPTYFTDNIKRMLRNADSSSVEIHPKHQIVLYYFLVADAILKKQLKSAKQFLEKARSAEQKADNTYLQAETIAWLKEVVHDGGVIYIDGNASYNDMRIRHKAYRNKKVSFHLTISKVDPDESGKILVGGLVGQYGCATGYREFISPFDKARHDTQTGRVLVIVSEKLAKENDYSDILKECGHIKVKGVSTELRRHFLGKFPSVRALEIQSTD